MKMRDKEDNDGFASHGQVLLGVSFLVLTQSPRNRHNLYTSAGQASQQANPVLTSRGVVRAIMEGWDLRVLFQALKPVLELQPPLLIQGPNRFAEVPVAGCRIEVQAW